MSKKILISFSGSRYHDTTKKIVEDGPRFGADEVMVFDDVWLKTQTAHCKATKWAFEHPKVRGVNWFCFKPYTIIKALEKCEPGDLICYTDADCWPVADMTPLFDMCDQKDIVLFAACGHLQRHWSKRDTQILMAADSDFWRDKQAGVARFMLFKNQAEGCVLNGKIPIQLFLDRWATYTFDQRLNTFDKSVLAEEYSDLKEARAEQAILTQMAHRLEIPLHREADQWGNAFTADFPNDKYGQIFESTGEYSYGPRGRDGFGSDFANVRD